jgi:hypothetical protein
MIESGQLKTKKKNWKKMIDRFILLGLDGSRRSKNLKTTRPILLLLHPGIQERRRRIIIEEERR